MKLPTKPENFVRIINRHDGAFIFPTFIKYSFLWFHTPATIMVKRGMSHAKFYVHCHSSCGVNKKANIR